MFLLVLSNRDLDKNVKSLHRCRARRASSSMAIGNEKIVDEGSEQNWNAVLVFFLAVTDSSSSQHFVESAELNAGKSALNSTLNTNIFLHFYLLSGAAEEVP